MSALPKVHATRLRRWMVWVLPLVALALVVGWETDWGRQIVRVPASAPPTEPKPLVATALPDYQIGGGLAAHSETVQRTLFNATRRPAPPAADDGPKQIARGKFQLMGTTVTGDHNVAFLKEMPGGKTRAVRQGDELDGMKVALVTPDRVKLIAGADSEELILKVAPGPKTTLVAPPPPPGAPGQQPAAPANAPATPNVRPAGAAQPAATPPTPQENARAARRAARAARSESGAAQDSGSTPGVGYPQRFRSKN